MSQEGDRGNERQGPENPIPIIDPFGGPVKKPPGDSKESGSEKHARRTTYATIAIMAFTGMQVLVAHCQWRSMQDALRETQKGNELARINAEATLRPWVLVANEWTFITRVVGSTTTVPPSPLTPPDLPDRLVAVQVALKNFGQLPAIWVHGQVESDVRPIGDPFPEDPPYQQPTNTGSLGTVAHDQPNFLDADVQTRNLDAVRNGTHTLYVYGYLKYSDEFRGDRGLIFCGMWGKGMGGWTPCPTYNLPW